MSHQPSDNSKRRSNNNNNAGNSKNPRSNRNQRLAKKVKTTEPYPTQKVQELLAAELDNSIVMETYAPKPGLRPLDLQSQHTSSSSSQKNSVNSPDQAQSPHNPKSR